MESINASAMAWARERFGEFVCPDGRRRARLVQMAAAVLMHPAGRVTRVFADSASREGAYDWLQHPDDDARQLARLESCAAIRACRDDPFVWVPVDMMDLHLTDRQGTKGTGRLHSDRRPRRGLIVTTALLIRADETIAGVATQTYFARPAGKVSDCHERSIADKETRFWGTVVATTATRIEALAPGCQPWFLCDRGADFADFILDNLRACRLWTVRAKHDRKVIDLEHARLRALVASQPVLGEGTVWTEDSEQSPRRRAVRVQLRACPVVLQLSDRLAQTQWASSVWAVSVTEIDAEVGHEALNWLLLTSYPVEDLGDAVLVVQGYGRRMRIEEYHRVWKSGGCDVESQQLRGRTIVKWSRLLSSVAVRLLQLRDASRTQPATSAAEWFSPTEIEATVLLRQPRDHTPGTPPTLGRMVRWIAELGGYTGKSSGGPPGIEVITRGWNRVEVAVEVLEKLQRPP